MFLRIFGLKWTSLFGLMGLVFGLTACGGDNGATGTPGPTTATDTTAATTITAPATTAAPSSGLTMKTAFAAVDPQVKGWKADAVYISIFIPEGDKVGIDQAGKAPVWFFEALSPTGFLHSYWSVKSADNGSPPLVTKTTEDTLPKERGQTTLNQQLPPLTGLIDSDKLMEVARQNGGGKSDRPVGTRLGRPAKEDETLAFDLLFYNGDDVVRLRIDAQSGKTIENVKG